jgi:proline racemase
VSGAGHPGAEGAVTAGSSAGAGIAGGGLPGAITTEDWHTAGEPFRIVTGGVPPLEGRTVLERRRWAAEHLDHVRRLVVNEPRGHADMYGCFVTPPDDDGADLGVVFFHNEGYSTACGHGTIALVTWALTTGRVAPTVVDAPTHAAPGGRRRVVVDVPSGRLDCTARVTDGRVAAGAFRHVPAWVLARDVPVETSRGRIAIDVAYGGAFYGSVEARSLGLDTSAASLPALIALQRELRPALEAALDVTHPDTPELRGIYGIIFWDREPPHAGADDGAALLGGAPDQAALIQRNVTVFADGEVDRSPCGSGTSARLALLDASGELPRGAVLRHRSIVGGAFLGSVAARGPEVGGRPSVVTEVTGAAFATGRHDFVLDPRDPLGEGFLLR